MGIQFDIAQLSVSETLLVSFLIVCVAYTMLKFTIFLIPVVKFFRQEFNDDEQ